VRGLALPRGTCVTTAVLALAALGAAGCGGGDDEKPASAAKVETTEGRVKAAVPQALEDSDKPADPDAGKRVRFVREPAQLPAPARREVSTLDVRPAPERLAARKAGAQALQEPDSEYDRFIRGVVALVDAYWRKETRKVSASAEYSGPGGLISYDGEHGPGCFGERGDGMARNAYYCASLLEPERCRVVASNGRFCVGGDVIAWDRSGLMLPFFQQIGALAAALVLAHEWGHLVQARVFPEFAYRTTIRNELQADCYGGAWAKEMQRQGRVDIGAFNQTLDLFEQNGGTGAEWLDPNSHGNKFQRIRSFTQGFERGATGCVATQFDRMLRRVGLGSES
jgi:hypothetical protein